MRKVDAARFEEKRQEILEAATRCFVRSGFQGASISDICGEAGVSGGHLYHYFENKEAIIAAMANAGLEAATAQFRKMVESSDPLEALVSQLDRPKAKSGAGKHTLLLDLLAEAGRNPAMAKVLQEHTRAMRNLLAEFLTTGQERGQIDPSLDPMTVASVLISIADGSKTLLLRDPKLDVQTAVTLMKTLVTRLLRPGYPADAGGLLADPTA